jgi:hypothetical protein
MFEAAHMYARPTEEMLWPGGAYFTLTLLCCMPHVERNVRVGIVRAPDFFGYSHHGHTAPHVACST